MYVHVLPCSGLVLSYYCIRTSQTPPTHRRFPRTYTNYHTYPKVYLHFHTCAKFVQTILVELLVACHDAPWCFLASPGVSRCHRQGEVHQLGLWQERIRPGQHGGMLMMLSFKSHLARHGSVDPLGMREHVCSLFFLFFSYVDEV